MAIIGTHTLLYTSEPEALRATLRDVFRFRHVDAGDGGSSSLSLRLSWECIPRKARRTSRERATRSR